MQGGRILEKPESEAEARAFITGYSLSSAQTVGSVLVTNLNSGKEAMAVDVAEVSPKGDPHIGCCRTPAAGGKERGQRAGRWQTSCGVRIVEI